MALTLHGGRATWDRAGKAGAAAGGGASNIEWLVTDQLGTPRMVVDETGSLAGVKRHDYLPFGEELQAGVGGRTANQGYGGTDNIRQKWTGYERDDETGLDFAQARYYASVQGRFTSPDPLLASGMPASPQSWNRYAYVGNNPLAYVDPSGMLAIPLNDELQRQQQQQQQQQNTNPYTKTTGNPADAAVDARLKQILTDGKNGIVVGADAFSNQRNKAGKDSHYQLADGTLHTVHVLGDEAGNKIVGVYAPKEFSQINYEGGKNGQVTATNPDTGEVLGFAHVDVSKAQLQKNNQKTNDDGSRLLGNVGGPGAHGKASAGNRHVHVTYYASAADRTVARGDKPATNTKMGDFGSRHAQHLRNFRTLMPK
ncbi:MAG: RHS repeat-associated core domain-containing protein [Acidobacteria bacterium]|nr:RHS repeat-associated core domain-containing protein [Acidobacteriota bacterium]